MFSQVMNPKSEHMSTRTVLVSGYSVMPDGIPLETEGKQFGITLEIDPTTSIIVNADITANMELGRQFICGLFIGYNLSNGVDDLVLEMRKRLWVPSIRSITKALENAYRRYRDMRAENRPRADGRKKQAHASGA